MVNETVKIKDKYRVLRKVIKILIIIFVILLLVLIVFAAGYLLKKPTYVEIVLENPLEGIVKANTNLEGIVDTPAVVEQAIIEFNEDYINYLLVALGTGYLHGSIIGGNPLLELVLTDNSGDEIWHAEVIDGMPNSVLGETENEDLRISLSKETAVRAILSEDVNKFMKDSHSQGSISLELIANKAELFAKGYLDMYKVLTGEEISSE
jgi:hypothetical protein